MAEDTMRAKARATFGSEFMNAAAGRAPAKNYATAQQKVAQDRPIPTFKVGGPVKRAMGGPPKGVTPKGGDDEATSFGVMGKQLRDIERDEAKKQAKKPAAPAPAKPVKKAIGGALEPVRQEALMGRMSAMDGRSPITGVPAGAQPMMKKGGKVQTSADTARKLATEMGGFKGGGKPTKCAVGGAGKTRKGMAPIKRAQGGAAKVRKGMATQSGAITPGVKPHRGIGM